MVLGRGQRVRGVGMAQRGEIQCEWRSPVNLQISIRERAKIPYGLDEFAGIS